MRKARLFWFRNDLRVVDNTALFHACQTDTPLFALYIITPKQWQQHHLAPIQADLIFRRLCFLKEQLSALNIPLIIKQRDGFDDVADCIAELVDELNIDKVFCNRQYAWNEVQRDLQVESRLALSAIPFRQFDDNCVLPPGSVTTKSGDYFKVFTPFRRAWLKIYLNDPSEVLPIPEVRKNMDGEMMDLVGRCSEQLQFSYPRTSSDAWHITDDDISVQLNDFCLLKAGIYKQNRDYPAQNGTSCLSPYLAIGAMSPRQCLAALKCHTGIFWENSESGAFTWWNELVWREFYHHLMAQVPRLSKNRAFHQWTEAIPWVNAPEQLKAWQLGRTGFPIVDAAMKQLLSTGWMHNRLRMIVACFLTKDLLIDWRFGDQWFIEHLIDGDFASNNGGWQWAASTGTDSQPYFRIFNPTLQGKRFDPQGSFIRAWLPQLRHVPDRFIHEPHLWTNEAQLDYPKPVVDHRFARQRAMDIFSAAKVTNSSE